MSEENYVDPFTSEETVGEKVKEEELNVCTSCEG